MANDDQFGNGDAPDNEPSLKDVINVTDGLRHFVTYLLSKRVWAVRRIMIHPPTEVVG